MPVVQIGSYDLNQSMYYSFGIKGDMAGLGFHANYLMDNRVVTLRNGSGVKEDHKDFKNAMTAIDLHVNYSVGSWMPYLEFRTFDSKEDSDYEVKANTNSGSLTDNGQVLALGVACKALGKGYTPFVQLASSSGDFYEDNNITAKSEARSGSQLRMGIVGDI